LGTQLGPGDDDSGESEAGEIVSSESVVSSCDASPILQLAEHAFDDVSALIGGAIEGVWGAPRGDGGNGGLPRGRCRLSASQASSDNQNKLFAMTIAPSDSNQAQIYNQNQ
jgi:hypothetical protein